ncbi:helix-turn-helix domain-containing protein [Actinomadura rudentiformis]|uniref:Helix-turn-helix domain-containing protein n=1 Tax=Actinomadura rudentiformis TaxID=359158 RepID=A0A6H9YSP5_9ACTN|nr:helix-turn-helix transcriptional regulator [Actinomadura rudentiformis]KAB2348483.1 helix-turn-helix domain-containing protein [Actinomadura rudentiformis]
MPYQDSGEAYYGTPSMPNEHDGGGLARDPLIELFARLLRGYRDHRKLSRPKLAEALGCSPQWIEKLESGGQKPSLDTARDLDTYYGLYEVFQAIAEAVEDLGKRPRTDLPLGFDVFQVLEAQANAVRSFCAQVVPGLLQTEDYARALMGAGQVRAKLEDRVRARLARQSILARDNPPRMSVILDESVLRRPVGGPKVMHDQLIYLLDVATHAVNVQLRVLPFERISWASTDGSFTVLSFADGPDVAYFEGTGVGVVLQAPDEVADAGLRFDLVLGEALTRAESIDVITTALEGYT